MTTEQTMPELPEAQLLVDCAQGFVEGFSASQMREYALAAIAAITKQAEPEPPTPAPAEQRDRDKLLTIIAYAYQIAGAHDVPAHILDVLSDPEGATSEQIEAMLPYIPDATAAGDLAEDLIAAGALRQLCHNDGTPGFVFAYDKDVTDRFIGYVVSQRVRAALSQPPAVQVPDDMIDRLAEESGLHEIQDGGRVSPSDLQSFARKVLAAFRSPATKKEGSDK